MDVTLYFNIPNALYPEKDADYSVIRKNLIEKLRSRTATFDEMIKDNISFEQYVESRENRVPMFDEMAGLKVRTVINFNIAITLDIFNAVENDSEIVYQLIIDLLDSDTELVCAHYSDDEYSSLNISLKEDVYDENFHFTI